jgi:hypothetical protein
LVEDVPHYGEIVARRLSSTDALVISDLSRLECRVKPMRDGNNALLDEFDHFFTESVSEVVPLSRRYGRVTDSKRPMPSTSPRPLCRIASCF